MKTMKKIVCALMTLVLLLSSVPAVFADEADTKTIDQDAACSLTVWKFDYTNAKKDGVWDEDAFPSTGWQESYVENALVNTNRKGDTDGQNGNTLGNGQTSKGYAIAGVEFTYLKVADIVTFQDQGTAQVLYGFHKTDAADLLKAIGLESGSNRCTEADSLDENRYFYTSDTLNKALAQSLEANSTTVKNALETFIRNGGTAMAPTSEVGKTSAKNLSVGLYLLVETKVPEMVTFTTNPFFVSLPMTTVTGNDNSASRMAALPGTTMWWCTPSRKPASPLWKRPSGKPKPTPARMKAPHPSRMASPTPLPVPLATPWNTRSFPLCPPSPPRQRPCPLTISTTLSARA